MKPLLLLLAAIGGVAIAMPNPVPAPVPGAFPEASPDNARQKPPPKCGLLGDKCEKAFCCPHYSCQLHVREWPFFFPFLICCKIVNSHLSLSVRVWVY